LTVAILHNLGTMASCVLGGIRDSVSVHSEDLKQVSSVIYFFHFPRPQFTY